MCSSDLVSSVSKKRLFLSTAARIKKKKEEKGRDLQRALCSGAPKQITVIINEQKKKGKALGNCNVVLLCCEDNMTDLEKKKSK